LHLLIGVVIAGVLSTAIDPDFASAWLGGGITAMLIMMVIGLPLYVCATGSIPLAMAFMYMGASPGAALVFLITGPATNAATITVTWKLLGKRTTVLYLMATAITALAAGFTIDWIGGWMLPQLLQHKHEHGAAAIGVFSNISAAVLLVMLGLSFYFTRRAAAKTDESQTADDPAATVLHIAGMTCSHCVEAVTAALEKMPGAKSVNVSLSKNKAYIRGEDIDLRAMIHAVESLGYRAH